MNERLSQAVTHFWATRAGQHKKQGSTSGTKDYGNRAAVTGGKQLDGFIRLINELLVEGGLSDATIYTKKRDTVLPGYFRPTKEWDLVVVVDGTFVASIEFKSQVGSFGNNFNNRVEEAVGNATDIWTAYREGAFAPSPQPWLGYLMLLEECDKSTSSVGVKEPHFKVFEEWRGTSYVKRYEKFCKRLVRERLYQSACFLLSDRERGLSGYYSEPSSELGFENFAASLIGHAAAYAKRFL